MTTAYHPQANGIVERAHRQLKDTLRARGAGTDLPLHLPWVLLGLQVTPKEISSISSAEAVFGGLWCYLGILPLAQRHPPSLSGISWPLPTHLPSGSLAPTQR
jgi:hypothetical protein